MVVLQKAKTPDGIALNLEDWRDHVAYPELDGLCIGAYPVAKNTGKYGWVRSGSGFRLTIAHNPYSGYTNEMVQTDFEALVSGGKKLEDLSAHFWNGKRDMWYLGMPVEYQGW